MEPMSVIIPTEANHDQKDKTDTSDVNGEPKSVTFKEDPNDAAGMNNIEHDAMTKSEKSLGSEKVETQYKQWLRFEMVALAGVIVIIWGLFALPIVFYHLPVGSDSESVPPIANNTCPSMPLPYDGDVCGQELKALSSCLPDIEQDGAIYVQRNMISNENKVLLSALESLTMSEECKAAALPFLCVYFFGLCDSTGKSHRPSSSQCNDITTGVCAKEWRLASNLPDGTLPECSSFPNETTLNPSMTCESSGSADDIQPNPATNRKTCTNSEDCIEDFFCSNSTGRCVPECGSWEAYPHTTTVITDTIVILAAAICVVFGIVLLVIAGVRWRTVIVFPSTFAVYQTITVLVLGSFFLINYMDRTRLFCSSKDLSESILTATPFCVISGMVLHYVMLQMGLWWLFHIMALFWKIRFPFHARRSESTRRIQCIHFTAIILALVIPAIPVVSAMIEYTIEDSEDGNSLQIGKLGFGVSSFPPVLCAGINQNITYYGMVLPLNLILIFGIALLVLIFWTIHKQHGLFRVMQSKNPYKIGTAERKLLIVFLYYIVFVIIALITFTIFIRNTNQLTIEIGKYFVCESTPGVQNKTCSRDGIERLTQPELVSITHALLGLFPVVNLIYVINIHDMKGKMKRLPKPYKPQPSTTVVSSI